MEFPITDKERESEWGDDRKPNLAASVNFDLIISPPPCCNIHWQKKEKEMKTKERRRGDWVCGNQWKSLLLTSEVSGSVNATVPTDSPSKAPERNQRFTLPIFQQQQQQPDEVWASGNLICNEPPRHLGEAEITKATTAKRTDMFVSSKEARQMCNSPPPHMTELKPRQQQRRVARKLIKNIHRAENMRRLSLRTKTFEPLLANYVLLWLCYWSWTDTNQQLNGSNGENMAL